LGEIGVIFPHLFPYRIFVEARNVGSVTLHSIKKKAKSAASGSATGNLATGTTAATAAPEISIPNTLTLTRKEFAAAFRLSLRTVERMIAAGEIQIRHIGPRAVRIPRTEAERYLQGKS
jgi:excisionase family DNA binding protein